MAFFSKTLTRVTIKELNVSFILKSELAVNVFDMNETVVLLLNESNSFVCFSEEENRKYTFYFLKLHRITTLLIIFKP